jgi:hypothetical protein
VDDGEIAPKVDRAATTPRVSSVLATLDTLDGEGLKGIADWLAARVRAEELVLEAEMDAPEETRRRRASSRASLYRAMRNALAHYGIIFFQWPADVTAHPNPAPPEQYGSRREFADLVRCVSTILEPK